MLQAHSIVSDRLNLSFLFCGIYTAGKLLKSALFLSQANPLSALNPQQRTAVKTVDTPLLVLAGAGTGKTRVITEKIAYLIEQGTPARHIAAITFTNKAAREMTARIGKLLRNIELRGLRVSTFHALGLDIVRREHKALGLKSALSVYDEQDRLTLIRDLIEHNSHGCSADDCDLIAHQIGRWKNDFVAPDQVLNSADSEQADMALIYQDYGKHMNAYNAVDFDDLIFKPVQLFSQQPNILEKWQNRIRYLLVDEYQDTNLAQYQLVKQLVGNLGRFTVVGDDDQSIYAWRGAQPENLAKLKSDFPRLKVIKLEQNYRSTERILRAANQLIEHNPHVFEKRLWSSHGMGEQIKIIGHGDETIEAQQVASEIVHHKFQRNSSFKDYAVLYRGNHQARLIEQAFREHNIPYRLSGGISFFGFTEIKDLTAYLRLIINHDDDCAFLRVANIPRREIGPGTLEKLGKYANSRNTSLYAACFELGLEQSVSQKAVLRLRNFCHLIANTAKRSMQGNAFAVVDDFISEMDYAQWLKESSSSDKVAERKIQNVNELLAWLKCLSGEHEEKLNLAETVAKMMLLDILDRNQEEQQSDQIHLLTLHAAKGLEFPFVHMVGVEENQLPHQSSLDEGNLEEERRLAYVGITRAQKLITLHYCKKRKRYSESIVCEPSRFLDELPIEDIEWNDKNEIDPEIKKQRGQANLAQLRNLLSTD